MRACVVYLCLLVTTFPLSVRSKPHGKHHGLQKASQAPKEKDVVTEEANKQQIVPPLVTFDASSQEQDDEELSSEDNTNGNKKDEGGKMEKSPAVLLSEEELVDLLRKEEEEEAAEREQEEEDEEEDEEEEVKAGKDEVESSEAVEIAPNKETEPEEELETEGDVTNEQGGEEESVEDVLEEEVGQMSKEKKMDEPAENEKHMTLFEDIDGSAESKIPVDVDYAADSGILQQFHITKAIAKTQAGEIQSVPKIAVSEVEEKETDEKPKADEADENQNMQNTEAVGSEAAMDQEKNQPEELSDKKTGSEDIVDPEEPKSGTKLDSRSQLPGKEEEKSKNDSGSHTKGKTRKQKKNQRARKHSVQQDGTQPEPGAIQQDRPESEDSSTENTVHKAKRRRAGKWGPLVGVNPVQIRATVDLYPRTRPSLGGAIHQSQTPADPCNNFRCKRGKTCKLDASNKPGCVCQQTSECPTSVNEFDHVCGTDNKTYETSCELFATKCSMEGTKKGHRLHLDYTGSCKLIPSCLDTELVQFPLRMRDWLKNVLLQLFEHDAVTSGFLTPKQRFRVKKIFESERRLHAGDHSVELLAQDFEKNYNMYIYPVHWQFAQLDQHPSDRFLSHSELAPLRVPLVPMEHCTSRFFQECDADKDRQVSFKEWTSCFGIKNEDMDVNLLF